MLDVDEFYRTGSPSINLGFAHPETRTSSIMDFKVCKANIARTQTEATVFIDWADCCCCGLVFVRSQFSSRLPDIVSRFLPGAGRYQILYTDYQNFAILWSCSSLANLGYTGKLIRSFFLPILHRHIHSFISLCFCFSVLIADQIWLMSRERKDFSLEIRTIIHDALTKLGLDPERLVLSKNRNCPKTLWENI